MLLKYPQRMEELFALLHKSPSKDNKLNEAYNNALLLEDEERAITESGRYSLKDVLYGGSTGTQSFCAATKPPMEKTAAWSRHSLRLLRLWTMQESLTAMPWRP